MKTTRKITAWLLTLALALTLAPLAAIPVLAAVGSSWSGSLNVTASETINGNVTAVDGATLHISAGATLTVNGTITVGDGNGMLTVEGPGKLLVRGQDGSSSNTQADGGAGAAAISGSLTVNDSDVTITGGSGGANTSSYGPPTSGSGGFGVSGTVTVCAGTVKVTGGSGGSSSTLNTGSGGAAIGGDLSVTGGDVTVFGGKGGDNSGPGGTRSGNGGLGVNGTMTVSGGTVKVSGGSGGSTSSLYTGSGGAAIGGDLSVDGGDVTVLGGKGGDNSCYAGAARSGDGGNGISGAVMFSAGTVKATGGSGGSSNHGVGGNGSGVCGDVILAADRFFSFGYDDNAVRPGAGSASEEAKAALNQGKVIIRVPEVTTWSELNAALKAGGGIVLDADVAPDNPSTASALTVPSGVTATLDLNGHVVDRGYTAEMADSYGSVFNISGTLTVTDSDPDADHGGAVAYTDPITGDTVEVSGGVITGGFNDQTGGGVQIQGGTFNMQGGSITCNGVGKTGFGAVEGLGGGVYMQSGSFHMSGGAVVGNRAVNKNTMVSGMQGKGGGVYVNGGTFTMSGGTVSGNEAGRRGGGVYLASEYSGHSGSLVSGGATVTGNAVGSAANNVYLEDGGALSVADTLTGTIGVTMQTPGVFTSGLSGMGTAANFTSDSAAYFLTQSGTEAALFPNPVVTFDSNGGTGTMANQTVVYGTATTLTANAYARAGYTFTGWNTESEGNGTSYADGAEVTLTAGLTLYARWRKNELAVADIAAQTYTSNALTPALTVTDRATGGPLTAGRDYTAGWENNTNAGTARVTVTGMGDYCAADAVVKQFTINRAEWANKTASASVRRGNSGAVDLSAQLAPGGTLGAPTVTAGDVVYSVGMDANVLRVSIRNDAAPGGTAAVSVPVTGAANYEDYAVTVTITATDKETQTLPFADAAVEKTYGDKPFINGLTHTGDGAVSYAVTAGDAVKVNGATGEVHVLKAGTATVTATAAETLQYAEASASYTVTVKPKPATVTADDKAKTAGDPDPALTATVTGLVNGDAAGVLTYGIECVHEETAGTYPIVVSGDTAQGNYSVTFVPGTLTISAVPTYAVTVVGGTADKTTAAAGETVTITATVPSGRLFDKWTSGDVTFADATASTTTFTMPAQAVTVTAAFKDKPAPAPVYDDDDDDDDDTPATYAPAIIAAEHSTVTTSPANPKQGDRVTITATPDAGYQFARVTVTDARGKAVAVRYENGRPTFTQPAGRVKVEAVFAPIPRPVGAAPAVALSPQRLTVNGAERNVEAYNIGGTNFFKLRDLAALLRATPARFNVDFDANRNAVVLTSGVAYALAAGESFTDQSASAVVSPQTVELDGRRIELTAYNIGGANFFGLRELSPFFGYDVSFDEAANTARIESR